MISEQLAKRLIHLQPHSVGLWEWPVHSVRCGGQGRGSRTRDERRQGQLSLSLIRRGTGEKCGGGGVGGWGEQKPSWLLLAFMLTCWPLGIVTHGFPSSDGLEADLPVVREYRAVLASPCVGGKILSFGFQVLSQEESG